MNEPQVWTLIGVFAAIMLGGMTLMTTLLTRNMNTAFAGFMSVMDAKFEAIESRFEAIDARFEAIGARFDEIDTKITGIQQQVAHPDRDEQTLTRREFGDNLG